MPKKLGIKAGHRVALVDGPQGFEAQIEPIPEGVSVEREAAGQFDIGILFCMTAASLEERIATAKARMKPDSALWIAWPKRASGLQTDMTEAVAQAAGLQAGLVDIKVCAIDEVWSGLKFVYRLQARK